MSGSNSTLVPIAILAALALLGCRHEPGHDESGASSEVGSEQQEEGAHREVKLTPEAIERYRVKTARAAKAVLVPEFSVAARVVFNAEATADVGTQVAGRAQEIRVRLGDVVKKGATLVVVDSPELGEAQSVFVTKHREAENAAPSVEVAKSAYERGKAFYDESRGITLTELQRREAEWKAAAAELADARITAKSAENRLHLLGMSSEAIEKLAASGEIDPVYRVTAPIDGQVVERNVTQGELVGPDRERLFVLADTRSPWIWADVPETRLPDVVLGSKVRLVVPALGAAALDGHVTLLGPAVDATTRTLAVRIEVTDSSRLRPGMFAQAWISRGGPPGDAVLAVPEEAVQTLDGATVVFVPSDVPNEFKVLEVEVGESVAGMTPIVSGLEEGQVFVSSGSFVLKAELAKPSAEEH